MSFILHGLGVSGGIAIGRAMLMSHATLEVSHLTIAPRMVDREIARFESAINAVKRELELMKESAENAPAELGAFIDIHTMFLDDPELCDKPRAIIAKAKPAQGEKRAQQRRAQVRLAHAVSAGKSA